MSNFKQKVSITDRDYTEVDHQVWKLLYNTQVSNLQNKAYSKFLNNLEYFQLPNNRIPKFNEVIFKLKQTTGWSIVAVEGLIEDNLYFQLLSQKKFPVATNIRNITELNLSKDPDIFHEIFGHCTMLLSPDYALFMQKYSEFFLNVSEIDKPLFARLIWFTTETGLINTAYGLRIFGSSILSSYEESNYALSNKTVIYKPFDITDIFREPYRADILQNVYYVVDNENQIYSLLDDTNRLYRLLNKARVLGEFKPNFEITYNKYSNIGHCK